MEAIVAYSQCGAQLVLEYRQGVPERDGEGRTHIPRIYEAMRIEVVNPEVSRVVMRQRDILRSPKVDLTPELAYKVTASLEKGGRVLTMTLDMRVEKSKRFVIPLTRQSFFTDAIAYISCSQIIHDRDTAKYPNDVFPTDGERAR